MKYKYNIMLVPAIFMLLVFGTSCTKNFQQLNTDPNLITENMINVDGLLTQVEQSSVFNNFGGTIAQYTNYQEPRDEGDPFLNTDFSGDFDVYYQNYLINLEEIIRLTAGDSTLSNKNAIAKIYKVMMWQQLTDRFGDVPFSQAALGVKDAILQPKYDSQAVIYKQLFTDLKEATAQLSDDPNQASYGAADLIYGGDVDSWRRFGNSLRLRMALRVSYVDPALAQANIADVINAPLIASDDQSAKLLSESYSTPNTNNHNPFLTDRDVYPNGLQLGFTPMDLLVPDNDPRLSVFYNKSNVGGWRGIPVNLSNDEALRYSADSISLVGNYFMSDIFRFNILTAAEVSFLEAEAALRGFSGGDPQALFQQGIQQAMQMVGVSQPDINTFLASPAGMLSGTPEQKLQQIIDQKYLALLFQPDEAWAEYRRTGYPLIWIGPAPTNTGGIIPRRMTYTFNEYLLNGANVKAAAARLNGGDVLTSRVWWDAKPGLPFSHPRQGMFPPETW